MLLQSILQSNSPPNKHHLLPQTKSENNTAFTAKYQYSCMYCSTSIHGRNGTQTVLYRLLCVEIPREFDLIYFQAIVLTLSPPSTTIVPYIQTAWIRMWRRLTRRLTRIQAVWHSDNTFTKFERYWNTLKTKADEKFSRREFIWRAKG